MATQRYRVHPAIAMLAAARLDRDVRRTHRPALRRNAQPTSRLTFDALRAANLARMPHFRNALGLPGHTKLDGTDVMPAQWLQALIGEIGEYANLRKKFERGDMPEAVFRAAAAKELADVMDYLDILAAQLGIDLGQATMDKFNEVSLRVGSTVRLLATGWHYADTRKDEPVTA